MANVKVWFAKEATVKLLTGGTALTSSPASGTALYGIFSGGSAITGVLKDISITEPAGDIDKIDLLGTDTVGFQNAEVEEKPAAMVEITGTMVLPGDEVSETFIYGGTVGTGAGFTAYNPGKATKVKYGVFLDLNDNVDRVGVALGYAYTSAKDVKVTGPDGHFEATFTAKGLPRDYRIEFKD